VGDFILKPFLRDIFSDSKAAGLSLIDAEINDFRNIEVRREWKNIDILISINDIVVCIENKIGIQDHKNQLRTYKEVVEAQFPKKKHAFVYLTPLGDSPNEERDAYINHSYQGVAEILTQYLKKESTLINPRIKIYLQDYLTTLKRRVMKEDPLNEMASKLYSHHKETLDFIFNNRPDANSEFRKLIQDKIRVKEWVLIKTDNVYIRFSTLNIQKHLPDSSSKTWKKKELFLFEIVKQDGRIYFKGTIHKGTDNSRKKLNDLLNDLVDVEDREEYKESWIFHQRYKFTFSFKEFENQSNEEREKALKDVWPELFSRVKEVENAIVKEYNTK
jgi:hypothetical protein